jgi:MOSC domain-containing protein YiiM
MSVYSVSMSDTHGFSKFPNDDIYLLAGCGVEGDIHCNEVPKKTFSSPRQVHLIASELFDELSKPDKKGRAYDISPGTLGENITTEGVDLINLSEGTKLHFGDHEGHAVVRVTGLRNPRKRLNEWPKGLLERCAIKNKRGDVVGRKIGVMGAVEEEGFVREGYIIYVEKPKTHKTLGNV